MSKAFLAKAQEMGVPEHAMKVLTTYAPLVLAKMSETEQQSAIAEAVSETKETGKKGGANVVAKD